MLAVGYTLQAVTIGRFKNGGFGRLDPPSCVLDRKPWILLGPHGIEASTRQPIESSGNRDGPGVVARPLGCNGSEYDILAPVIHIGEDGADAPQRCARVWEEALAMRQVALSLRRLTAAGLAVLVALQVVGAVPPHVTRIMARSAATPVPGAPITLDARQAQEVAVLVDFIRAYNTGQTATALALFGPPWLWSDCDYRHGQVIGGKGIISLRQWLVRHKADHDRLDIGTIAVGTEQEQALGVTFQRRTNDTLRDLGKSKGLFLPSAPRLSLVIHQVRSL
jgi:hypothetical protein